MKKIIVFVIAIVSMMVSANAQISSTKSTMNKQTDNSITMVEKYSIDNKIFFDNKDNSYVISKSSVYKSLPFFFPLGNLNDAKKSIQYLINLLNDNTKKSEIIGFSNDTFKYSFIRYKEPGDYKPYFFLVVDLFSEDNDTETDYVEITKQDLNRYLNTLNNIKTK